MFYKDLYRPIEEDPARPKDKDDSVYRHVAGETDVKAFIG